MGAWAKVLALDLFTAAFDGLEQRVSARPAENFDGSLLEIKRLLSTLPSPTIRAIKSRKKTDH